MPTSLLVWVGDSRVQRVERGIAGTALMVGRSATIEISTGSAVGTGTTEITVRTTAMTIVFTIIIRILMITRGTSSAETGESTPILGEWG